MSPVQHKGGRRSLLAYKPSLLTVQVSMEADTDQGWGAGVLKGAVGGCSRARHQRRNRYEHCSS
jgi:hypothetical protein